MATKNSALLPVKTDEVVVFDGVKHVVGNVQLTADGPILELLPIKAEPLIVHASEVSFPDQLEADRRAKLIGIAPSVPATIGRTDTKTKSLQINIPENMTREQAKKMMDEIAARIKASVFQ